MKNIFTEPKALTDSEKLADTTPDNARILGNKSEESRLSVGDKRILKDLKPLYLKDLDNSPLTDKEYKELIAAEVWTDEEKAKKRVEDAKYEAERRIDYKKRDY